MTAFLRWFAWFGCVVGSIATAAAQAPPAADRNPADPPAASAPQLTAPAGTLSKLLADAKIVAELQLGEAQQAQIAKVLAVHADAIKQAADSDRAVLMADADRQLLDLLDADQRARLDTIVSLETKRLRFNFRFQPWVDVLNWFAEQADLSLVLDAPPPGTFNYTDNREYSLPEAIDLLNGVLLTKGFTLVRRERMLMLLDLEDGLPADLVPRVELTDLDRRGKYEMVSVVFPLGGRNAEEAKTEVTPLLGPHGSISVLPKTGQLVVVDTAGKMRAIRAVIESLPTPQSKPDSPAKAEPELAVFPATGLDAKVTQEVVAALYPDSKLVFDAKANQLLGTVTAERKAQIEAVLTTLRGGEGENRPRLERHPVKLSGRAQLIELLRVAVPEAVVRPDAETNELIVWGTGAQQQLVREQIAAIGEAGTPAAERQLEVYHLRKTDTANALALLQKLVPEARLAVDPGTKSLVALASIADQNAIKSTLLQLESSEDERATLEVYRLNAEQQKKVQSVLTALAAELPGIRVVPDAIAKELAVWAKPLQHPIIKEVVDQLSHDVPEEDQFRLVVYRFDTADLTSALSVLQTLLPEVKFVPDAKAKQISAWARAEDHLKIRATVDELDAEAGAQGRLEVESHPLGKASPDAVLATLRVMLPQVQLTSDTKGNALVAWARQSEHAQIREAIERSQPQPDAADRQQMVAYPVLDADAPQLASMLSTVVPTARFSGDRASSRILAWATPDEHEMIRVAVEGMVKQLPAGRELRPVVYRPRAADLSSLLVDLRALVPEARLAADAKNGVIMAWATEADQEKIRATIEGLEAVGTGGGDFTVAVYAAPETDSATLMLLLQAAVPQARLVPDAKAGTVIAWAPPADHETLRRALEGLSDQSATEKKRTAKIYRFHSADANAALTVLRSLVPSAQLAVDVRTGSLAATATAAEHEQIAATVAQMEGEGAGNSDLDLRVYPLRSPDATTVLTLLRELFVQRPEVRLSVDSGNGKLVAWALPSQHQLIENVLSRVDRPEGEPDDRQIEVHKLGDASPQTVMTALTTMFRDARKVRIVLDEKGNLVTVWGSPQVQRTVRATIEQMQGRREIVDVIPLEVVDPYTARQSIDRLFGDPNDRNKPGVPRVDSDPDSRQIVVRASQDQIDQIRQMLVQMGEVSLADRRGGGSDRRVRVIPLSDRSAKAALEEIQRIWPQLRANPIQVVRPSALVPKLNEERRAKAAEQNPAPAPLPRASETEADSATDSRADEAAGCQEAEPSQGEVSDQLPAEPAAAPGLPEAEAATPEPGEELPPAIIVAPSGDSITITSDDPEALDQFEQLLKNFVQKNTLAGREFHIFYLKRANAANVSDMIDNVFHGGMGRFRSGGVIVVPDQRLNAVIVQAGRNELASIEKLIEVLDSSETPDGWVGNRPTLIPVKNTPVDQIAEMLRDVYKSKLTASGSGNRKKTDLPTLRPDLALVMQQLTAGSGEPEMSIGVDYTTNSLIVTAPPPLLKEVEELVQKLDAQSDVSRPTVRVMALKKTNTKAVEKALQELVRRAGRSGRRGRGAGAP